MSSIPDGEGAPGWMKPKPKPSSPRFQVGEEVEHSKFGLGKIVGIDNGKAVVNFGGGRKRIDLSFLKRPLGNIDFNDVLVERGPGSARKSMDELAAILRAPAMAVGISDAERASFELSIISEHAPAELAEKKRLEEVFELALAATKAAGELAQSLNDPAELTRIEMGEAEANEAGASFEQALAGE